MIGGNGGRKIETLGNREWLERRYRQIKGVVRVNSGRVTNVGRRQPVPDDQAALGEVSEE